MVRERGCTPRGHFTAYPQCVAEHHAHEWKREWCSEDTIGFNKEISCVRALREQHFEEARGWAGNLDLRAGDVRKACLSFPSKAAIGPRPARIQRHRPPP